jgi:hypothetical protein
MQTTKPALKLKLKKITLRDLDRNLQTYKTVEAAGKVGIFDPDEVRIFDTGPSQYATACAGTCYNGSCVTACTINDTYLQCCC